ncbi:LEA type 2 family protein [Teredinibacter franksiae]|uniref:LEA type 2 family protein n=1 Tax=Teredinibacter franksiae TaxID=2761453 RepID=UPI0016283F00|nr:LEA type 2 family protein [Teredinibacter franksiae]
MKKITFGLVIIWLLTGCAAMQLEQPQISIIGFRPVSSSGLNAMFELDIRISNPNSITLPIAGMSYEFAVNDAGLLKGVSNAIDPIPPYSSQDIKLQLSANLLSAPKLLYSLLKSPGDFVHYSFTTKVDLQGPLPSFRLVEDGKIAIGGNR